ncbi:MAG: pyridoxal phosphate-dependent aminotransferase [Desulfocapsa sp.]|nr:pyridoxal phosphate-dependent aminotransferase [Desulfocapsa sp.]
MKPKLSKRSKRIAQSDIRSMSIECMRLKGINMAQGVCDLPVPESVLQGAKQAMDDGFNIYTASEGMPEPRRAIAEKMKNFYGMDVTPDEVLISQGATGAFYATAHALLDEGDEVVLLEPYYGYHASTLISLGCGVNYARLDPPEWNLTREILERAISSKTRAILISNPSNPSGKVFSLQELELLRDICVEHDLVLFSDEIYEFFIYDGRKHIPPATISGMRERTVTISGFSKIFSVTGWRLGYAIAQKHVIAAAAQFNDLVYVCAPAPLQLGVTAGLAELPVEFYEKIAAEHQEKRDRFCEILEQKGLKPAIPEGAYYVMADVSNIPGKDDREKAMFILEKTGVASVPGRAFYHDDSGKNLVRFCFAKESDVLDDACERLKNLKNN